MALYKDPTKWIKDRLKIEIPIAIAVIVIVLLLKYFGIIDF